MMHPPPEWRVDIDERGRGGLIQYREPAGVIDFHWEFGGAVAAVIIRPAHAARWAELYPWADQRRVLHRVAAEVIRQKAPTCTAAFDADATILIQFPKRA